MPSSGHIPVLQQAVVELLAPRPGECAVDCTLGLGGHAATILPKLAPGGRYLGLDLDPANLAAARRHLEPIATEVGVKLTLVRANFRDLAEVLTAAEIPAVDLLLADLGFASTQMDDPARGFSFAADGPLDMRLDPDAPLSAADLVNQMDQRELADLIYTLGEERLNRKIARKIVETRAQSPIQTTKQLAAVVRRAYGNRGRNARIDPATRTFMALRIAVNAELDALDELLEQLPDALAPGGRAAVISFHSLEDRRVKQAFLHMEQHQPFERLTRKPRTAEPAEIVQNPRSRSAKLRSVRKLARLTPVGD